MKIREVLSVCMKSYEYSHIFKARNTFQSEGYLGIASFKKFLLGGIYKQRRTQLLIILNIRFTLYNVTQVKDIRYQVKYYHLSFLPILKYGHKFLCTRGGYRANWNT